MTRTKKSDLPPPAREDADLVVKQAWECSSRFNMWFAPSLFIFGNRAGFAWLSDYFAWLANSINERSDFDDDLHVHLEHDAPLNMNLSDMVGLKLVCMPRRHRRRILESLGIDRKSSLSGSPIVQWARILNHMVARSIEGNMNSEDRSRLCKEIRQLVGEAEACVAALQQVSAKAKGGDRAASAQRRKTSSPAQRRKTSRNRGLFGFSLASLNKRRHP